ncbi:hypothetical protein Hdeb2414_s0001g00006181 [Helianthus debilis subsp. tardiflorus]
MHRLLRFDWGWLIEIETAIVLLNTKKAKTLNERGRGDRGGQFFMCFAKLCAF